MKKLISVLMTLCLLCAAFAAIAETAEAPLTIADMAKPVTLDEGVELTDADFEGEWIVGPVFLNETYLTVEQIAEAGMTFRPMRIAEGKIFMKITDEQGEHEVSTEYVLEDNQISFKDDEGVEATIDKLDDGNIVMSIFLPGEGDVMNSISVYMVHPEA
jgi:hypothetical protein